MNSDRELLELAAKAAGYDGTFVGDRFYFVTGDYLANNWRPLDDDGDALRLAVKLELDLFIGAGGCEVEFNLRRPSILQETKDNDPYAATRRAIVRAAAEIGRNM